jgi:hypothetical protein
VKFLRNIKVKLTSWYLLMVAMLVVFFGVVAYFLLVDGLSQNTVNPWDMRMADMVDLPDGSARVTGFNTVTGKLGADESSVALQVPVSRLIQSASENGTIEIRTLGGKPILVKKICWPGLRVRPQAKCGPTSSCPKPTRSIGISLSLPNRLRIWRQR